MFCKSKLCLTSAACVCFLVTGCGGGTKPPANGASNPTTATNQTSTSEQSADSNTTSSSRSKERKADEVWTDEDGNKYIGKVPYDAFFDQPYSVASNVTPIGGTPAIGTVPATTGASGMGGVAPPPTTAVEPEPEPTVAEAGAGAWDEMISVEVLEAEITSIRNFLNATLQSVGSYNSSMLMIEPKAASVAVLSGISVEHPGEFAWKEDALYIRDMAKQMTSSPLQRGKKDQVRLLELFENMTDTFSRSRPADLPEPPAEDGFVDVAEMRFLMKRMEEAEQKMKTEAGTESAFTAKKDMIKHEATILATFTHVIALEEYGYGDDEEFTGYAKGIIDAAKNIQNSAEVNDFSNYQLALSSISTNCQQCHSVFKNN